MQCCYMQLVCCSSAVGLVAGLGFKSQLVPEYFMGIESLSLSLSLSSLSLSLSLPPTLTFQISLHTL